MDLLTNPGVCVVCSYSAVASLSTSLDPLSCSKENDNEASCVLNAGMGGAGPGGRYSPELVRLLGALLAAGEVNSLVLYCIPASMLRLIVRVIRSVLRVVQCSLVFVLVSFACCLNSHSQARVARLPAHVSWPVPLLRDPWQSVRFRQPVRWVGCCLHYSDHMLRPLSCQLMIHCPHLTPSTP